MAVNQMLGFDLAEVVKKLLGTSYRKGRNDYIAAPVQSFLHDPDQLGNMILTLLMEPVSISRLHDCVVCLFGVDRIPDQRLIEVTDITGKDDFLLHTIFLHPDFDGG